MGAGRQRQTAWFWRSWAVGVMLLTIAPLARAALSVTPPQLHPDETGIVVTEVQSSLQGPSRWSVRLVRWAADGGDPTPIEGHISPRFFRLEAGGRQMIRAQVKDRGLYYRLLV